MSFSRKKREKLGLIQKELRLEISKREAVKSQKRDTTERNKLEKQPKNSDLTELLSNFPDFNDEKKLILADLLKAKLFIEIFAMCGLKTVKLFCMMVKLRNLREKMENLFIE